MKKKSLLMLTLVLALSVFAVACGGGNDTAYKDGTWTAESDYDEHGWKGVIEIEIEDGKISDVDYEEVNEAGEEKSDDKEYGEMMKDSSGVSPEEAFEQLEEALKKNQNPDNIDAVAGATTTSTQFVELANKALESAK